MSERMIVEGQIVQDMILIPGVRKCGTTTLFDALGRHSAIAVPAIKEPQFFSLAPATVAVHLEWYQQLFPNAAGKRLLDGSAMCFRSPFAPALIKKHVVNPKILIILRDPAKRVFSAYLHMYKQVPCADSRSFNSILQAMEVAQRTGRLAESENDILQRAIANGTVEPDCRPKEAFTKLVGAPSDSAIVEPLFSYKYFQESCYRWRLPAYESVFGENLHLVFFEELISDPPAVLAVILDFLQLAPEVNVSYARHLNRTSVPKNARSRRLLSVYRKSQRLQRLVRVIRQIGFQAMVERAKQTAFFTRAPKMSNNEYNRTREVLSEEYAYWFERFPKLRLLWRY